MNVYIKMEIKVRELEGRTLLGLIAAERGHHALIGRMRDFFTPDAFILPPGIYHDKALTPTPRKLAQFARIRESGSVITSQDEEHGLTQVSYDAFAKRRFSEQTLAYVDRVFAWGQHDLDGICDLYPAHKERLVPTGSPRVDLWSSRFNAYQTSRSLPGITPGRPFVLVSSNFHVGSSVPFSQRNQASRQPSGASYTVEAERFWYLKESQDYAILADLIPALRQLAAERTDIDVVLRPHPKEDERAWRRLLGDDSGVLVVQSGAIGPWIRGAAAVVHNGCTSGFESAVVGTPTIVFSPPDIERDAVVNHVGRRAADANELVALVDRATATRVPGRTDREYWLPAEGQAILAQRFSNLDGAFAAEAIVDAWEEVALPGRNGGEGHHSPTMVGRSSRSRAGHRASARGISRRAAQLLPGRRRAQSGQKFSPITREEVAAVVTGMQRSLDRFHDIEVQMRGTHAFELRPRRAH